MSSLSLSTGPGAEQSQDCTGRVASPAGGAWGSVLRVNSGTGGPLRGSHQGESRNERKEFGMGAPVPGSGQWARGAGLVGCIFLSILTSLGFAFAGHVAS